jgi:hypothetical protein
LSFKSSTSHITLKTWKKTLIKSSARFCKFGRRIEFLLECGLSLADKSEMECLQMAVPLFPPSLGPHQQPATKHEFLLPFFGGVRAGPSSCYLRHLLF